jgi:hypothetical protein
MVTACEPTISERTTIGAAEFVERFYAANRPVVYRDVASDSWPVLNLTPEYLRERYGEEIVEVFCDRRRDGHMWPFRGQMQTMTLREFAAGVIERPDNERYICSHNPVLQRTRLREILEHCPKYEELFEQPEFAQKARLWFGGAGVVTWLHFDIANSMMLQVYGRKRFLLAPPEVQRYVCNDTFGFSEVNAEKPDYERFPLFRNVRFASVEIGPGDLLFVPVGWWHHVRTLETSISLSYTNFRWPNEFGSPERPAA